MQPAVAAGYPHTPALCHKALRRRPAPRIQKNTGRRRNQRRLPALCLL